MTESTRFGRVWPSLVALIGTLAVVFGLLYLFGDDTGSTADDNNAVTEEDQSAGEDADPDDESDDETSAAGETSEGGEDAGTDEDDESPPDPVEAPEELKTPLGVLNATSVAGLAAGAKERFEAGGWPVGQPADYSGELAGTTVFYPTEELRESAEALRAQFPEIRSVEPTIGGLTQERLVVILADDYAEAVGDSSES